MACFIEAPSLPPKPANGNGMLPQEQPRVVPKPSTSLHQHPSKITTIKNLNADKKEVIKGIKKAMVRTMTQANTIPHFSYCDEYNMNFLVDLRSHLKQIGKERGINISYLPIIIKVSLETAFKQV